MLEVLDFAVLAIAMGVPGAWILELLRLRTLAPELWAAASLAMGLTAFSLIAWVAYVTGTGLYGAIALCVGLLGAVALTVGMRWIRVPTPPPGAPFMRLSFAGVAVAGALAGFFGPWYSDAADTFYHLAAAAAVVRHHQALPQEIFFNVPVPYPDATTGTLNSLLGWLAAAGGMFNAFDALTVFGAAFAVLSFIAFASELTRSRVAGLVAGLLYLVYHSHFDLRIAGYPNQLAPGIGWLAIVFMVRYARAASARDWPDLAAATLLAFGAGAVHPGMPPFLIVVAAASVGAAAVATLLRRSIVPVTRMAAGAVALAAGSAPLLLIRLAALPPPGVDASLAAPPPLLHSITTGFGITFVDPRFWFLPDPAMSVLGTVLLLLLPLRALRAGDGGGAVLWGGSLFVPIAAFVPLLVSRPEDYYYFARIAILLKPVVYVVVAWHLAAALPPLFAFARTRRPSVPALAAAVLVALLAFLSVNDARAIARLYLPGRGGRSMEVSLSHDLTRRWADRLAAFDRLGPGVVLADVTVSYELAGLTGREVVAVYWSHFPIQDEARDGALRRGDVADALSAGEDQPTLASILERYHVAYVLVDAAQDPPDVIAAAAREPLYQRVAGGSGWSVYRYARERLDAVLAVPMSAGVGISPAVTIAGRGFFVRLGSCCAPGTVVHVRGAGQAHGATFDSNVRVEAGNTGSATLPVLVADDVPPDRYAVDVSVASAQAIPAGDVTVDRDFEAEYFAGVLPMRDVDKNAWHQWVSIGGSFSRGLVSYTRTPGATATRPLDVPAGRYCLTVHVIDSGSGTSELTVAVSATSLSFRWEGGGTGTHALTEAVDVTGRAETIRYSVDSQSAVPVLLDAITLAPVDPSGGC